MHAACWAHARRYFMDALKVNPQETAAARAVAAIDDPFAIDAQARSLGLDAMARHELRLGLARSCSISFASASKTRGWKRFRRVS